MKDRYACAAQTKATGICDECFWMSMHTKLVAMHMYANHMHACHIR